MMNEKLEEYFHSLSTETIFLTPKLPCIMQASNLDFPSSEEKAARLTVCMEEFANKYTLPAKEAITKYIAIESESDRVMRITRSFFK